MATIGQPLLQPESGWRRYDDTDSNIKYIGIIGKGETTQHHNGSVSQVPPSASLMFNFTGNKIRIIAFTSASSRSEKVSIKINGEEEFFSTVNTTTQHRILVYEKILNSSGKNFVQITNASTTGTFSFDAIDIDENYTILPYIAPKMTLKNPTTNRHYSLADKTLIHLPSSSDKNMISHGIESGKEIKLDEDFDKMKYVQDASEVLGEGKTFTHAVDMSNTKINKIIL